MSDAINFMHELKNWNEQRILAHIGYRIYNTS
jgi:hypothetical protein